MQIYCVASIAVILALVPVAYTDTDTDLLFMRQYVRRFGQDALVSVPV